MFEGEKTNIFWIGLLILGLASVGLFGILWMIVVWNGYLDRFRMLKQAVPVIVGGVVFVLIGFYMMNSGVKRKAKMQSRNKEKEEKEITPRKSNNNNDFSQMGALLDFFSDRAVAHASFFVASVFGMVTILAVIQQLDDNLFIWLSTLLFYSFAYAGCYTLIRFNYYANIAHKLSYSGLERGDAFQRIKYGKKNEERTLQYYVDTQSRRQRRWLFSERIFHKYPEWRIQILGVLYWFAIYLLGSIAYSKFWKCWALAIWLVLLAFLSVLVFYIIPHVLDRLFEKKESQAQSSHPSPSFNLHECLFS